MLSRSASPLLSRPRKVSDTRQRPEVLLRMHAKREQVLKADGISLLSNGLNMS